MSGTHIEEKEKKKMLLPNRENVSAVPTDAREKWQAINVTCSVILYILMVKEIKK